MAKATTVRFTDEVFARLDKASAQTGMPVNSIVVAACLEWMHRHLPPSPPSGESELALPIQMFRPRWSTLRRAVKLAVAERTSLPTYPFDRFTSTAQKLLTAAQIEAEQSGFSYIGTEHLLLAAFVDSTSHAAHVLSRLQVTELAARTEIELALHNQVPHTKHRIVPTSRVKKVIEIAFDLCGAGRDASVSTGHILLAIAREGGGIAAHVLKDLGVTSKEIEAAMEQLTESEA